MSSKAAIIIAFSVVLLVCVSTIFFLKNEIDVKERQLERLRMLEETKQLDLSDDQTLEGFAHPDGYMVVWVKDKEFADVLETCTHEYMHINANMIHPDRDSGESTN